MGARVITNDYTVYTDTFQKSCQCFSVGHLHAGGPSWAPAHHALKSPIVDMGHRSGINLPQGPLIMTRPVQVLGTTKRKRMLNRPIMGTEQHHPLPTRLHCPAYALISTQKKPERQEAYALSPASNNIHRGVSTHADYRVLRRRYRLSSYLSPYQAPTCPSPSKSFL